MWYQRDVNRRVDGCAHIAIFVLLLTALVSGYSADSMQLAMIPRVNLPQIEKKKMSLTVEFVFDTISSEYFIYYNKEKSALIIEFFGKILGDSLPVLSGTDNVRNLRVENSTTDLAFNNKVGRLVMDIDAGWHYESNVHSGKILQLSLWTILDPAKKLQARRSYVKYLFAGAGVSLATVLIFFFING